MDLGLINGKRERHSFKTRPEAETFAEARRVERQDEGTAALAFLPDRRLAEITVEELEEWLDQEDWSPRSRINYLTKISQLY